MILCVLAIEMEKCRNTTISKKWHEYSGEAN